MTRKRAAPRVSAIATALLIGATVSASGSAQGANSQKQSQIAFVRNDPALSAVTAQNGDPIGDIYVMNADGSGQRRLTRNSDAVDEFPAWSPDGQKIVFTSNRSGTFDLWLMNADGSGARKLRATTDVNYDQEPAWSPDGSKIAFVGHRHYAGSSFYTNAILVMNSDGTQERRLALARKPGYAPNWSYSPTWSPDGARIAFSRFLGTLAFRNPKGDFDLWVMNADGSHQRHLKNTCCYAAWSPDGRWIAYMRAGDLFLTNPDGSYRRRLTRSPAFEVDPTWSPDGKQIAYASDAGGNFDIWVMNADGTGKRRLTHDRAEEGQPAWSP